MTASGVNDVEKNNFVPIINNKLSVSVLLLHLLS
jgi:hypothetical protein